MIISKEDFLRNLEGYTSEMGKGKIFVYPTDTIYGIGCDACNSESVLKIREIKKREDKPFSVIVPGKKWIRKNCVVDSLVESWISKLPGAYTLILELKNLKAVSIKVNNGIDSLGIRIPDNWFADVVKKFGRPFVTTSVNISGEKSAESIEEIDKEILIGVDYIIEDGMMEGSASKIVKLINGREEVIR